MVARDSDVIITPLKYHLVACVVDPSPGSNRRLRSKGRATQQREGGSNTRTAHHSCTRWCLRGKVHVHSNPGNVIITATAFS